jgi:hypothetical protein
MLAEPGSATGDFPESVKTLGCQRGALLRPRRRSTIVASAAAFAAVYAIIGLVPLSRLVGISSFITMREAISPLAGMLFGPVGGGLSMVLGVYLDFLLGRPVAFLGLDFLIDLMAAVTAGLCFLGRRRLAVILPSILVVIFLFSPSSVLFVDVGGVPVPFVWMHLASIIVLAGALRLEAGGHIKRTSALFVAPVMFASTMAGHITGGILTEYIYLSAGTLFGAASAQAYWTTVFYLYPAERLFLTFVGTLVSVPVLRAVSSRRPPTTVS